MKKPPKIMFTRLSLFFSIVCFTFSISNAQEVEDIYKSHKFYLQVKAGYATPIVSYSLDTPLEEIVPAFVEFSQDSVLTRRAKFGTFGGGLKAELQIGRYLSNNFAIELGYRYNNGSTVNLADVNRPGYVATHDVQTTWHEINPGIVISTGFNKRFSAYAKLAASLPIAGKTESNVSISDTDGNLALFYAPVYASILGFSVDQITPALARTIDSEVSVVAESEGDFSVGFIGSLGGKLLITDNLSIIGELSMQSLHIKILETNYTEFSQLTTFNGVPVLSDDIDSVVPYFAETIYLDEVDSNSNYHVLNQNVDVNQPKEELAFKQVYSTGSILVGIRFSF